MPPRLIGPKRQSGTFYKKRPKKINKVAASSVRKIAKSVLSRMTETKSVMKVLESNIPHNSAITGADLIPVLPALNQGTDDYERIGDQIRPTGLVVKGLIASNRTYVNTNQVLLVRVVIISPKASSSAGVTVPLLNSYAAELLQPNLSTGTQVAPFNGNQVELQYPINRDSFHVHFDKTFRIAPSKADAAMEENPAEYRTFTKSIKLPAKLTYDTGVNFPNNFCPIYGLGYAYADGTGPDTLATTKIISNVTARLTFKDS